MSAEEISRFCSLFLNLSACNPCARHLSYSFVFYYFVRILLFFFFVSIVLSLLIHMVAKKATHTPKKWQLKRNKKTPYNYLTTCEQHNDFL